MNCIQNRRKILEATTYPEVRDIIESSGLPNSSYEHARLAYQIRANQPDLSRSMLESVVSDMEKKEKEGVTINPTGNGLNKTLSGSNNADLDTDGPFDNEYEGNRDVGGSSRSTPSKRLDHQSLNGETDDMGMQNTDDQKSGGPKLTEDMMAGAAGGMGLHPDIMRQMAPQMNQMPPMSFPNQIKQMQYTIKQALGPVVKEIQRLRDQNTQLKEALRALDGKVQETISNRGSVRLDLQKSDTKRPVRETQSVSLASSYESIEDKRAKIAFMDKQLG